MRIIIEIPTEFGEEVAQQVTAFVTDLWGDGFDFADGSIVKPIVTVEK